MYPKREKRIFLDFSTAYLHGIVTVPQFRSLFMVLLGEQIGLSYDHVAGVSHAPVHPELGQGSIEVCIGRDETQAF